MTIDDIKDKVPSSIRFIHHYALNDLDVIVDSTYIGYLCVTPEGVYFKTWLLTNQDHYYRVNSFLKRFEFELLICIRANMSDYQIYRLIE